ncbi:MAG: hypothetical protein ACLFRI_05990 [Candidatus Izemoplasmataceae bacterium]
MLVIKQSFNVFKALLNFKDYKYLEIFLKSVLLLLIFPLMLILWVSTWLVYGLERLLSPLYKKLVAMMMRLFSLRAYQKGAKRFLFNLIFLIMFLISLPFIIVYYLAIFVKFILKKIMKGIILKLDFSIQFSENTLLIFDDILQEDNAFNAIFKDAAQTQAFSKMLENLINNSPENTIDSDENPQK